MNGGSPEFGTYCYVRYKEAQVNITLHVNGKVEKIENFPCDELCPGPQVIHNDSEKIDIRFFYGAVKDEFICPMEQTD